MADNKPPYARDYQFGARAAALSYSASQFAVGDTGVDLIDAIREDEGAFAAFGNDLTAVENFAKEFWGWNSGDTILN